MPMPELITQRFKLRDIYPDGIIVIDNKKEYDLVKHYKLPDDVELIRKGVTPDDLKFEDGERAVISHITTGAKDRDDEVVNPKGAILTDYRKNPVVLFGHDHRELPIGKNLWIKSDEKGLVAKTQYATHAKAEEVYQYRKEGMPMAQSIGFVPVEVKNYAEESDEYKQGIRREYTKWILLEYSDVPVPSNPEALQIAISKGLLTMDEADQFTIVINDAEDDPDDASLPLVESSSTSKNTLEGLNEHELSQVADFVYVMRNTKDDSDGEEKAGRVLSAKNRSLISTASATMGTAVKALNDLLAATDESPKEDDEKQQYACECIECGWTVTTEQHCVDIKCEECGGEMRRAERPGEGRNITEAENKGDAGYVIEVDDDDNLIEVEEKDIDNAISDITEANVKDIVAKAVKNSLHLLSGGI